MKSAIAFFFLLVLLLCGGAMGWVFDEWAAMEADGR